MLSDDGCPLGYALGVCFGVTLSPLDSLDGGPHALFEQFFLTPVMLLVAESPALCYSWRVFLDSQPIGIDHGSELEC